MSPAPFSLSLGHTPPPPRSWGNPREEPRSPRLPPERAARGAAARAGHTWLPAPAMAARSCPGRGGGGTAQAPLSPRLMQPGAAEADGPGCAIDKGGDRASCSVRDRLGVVRVKAGHDRRLEAGQGSGSVRTREGGELDPVLAQPRCARCRGKNHRIN